MASENYILKAELKNQISNKFCNQYIFIILDCGLDKVVADTSLDAFIVGKKILSVICRHLISVLLIYFIENVSAVSVIDPYYIIACLVIILYCYTKKRDYTIVLGGQ